MWQRYSAYPKKIAFKNGKIWAFCANSNDQTLWWDRNDHAYHTIPKQIINSKNGGEMPPEDMLKIIADQPQNSRQRIADDRKLSPAVLEGLAGDESQKVRTAVADNPNTPAEALARLAEDKFWQVRQKVARNSNTPPDILVHLAQDDSVVYTALENSNMPVNVLYKYVHLNQQADSSIASNKNTPADILARLANHNSDRIKQLVAGNPNTSTDILIKLADDPDSHVRMAVAGNPNTPADLLVRLMNDKSSLVKSNVAETPNISADILIKLADDPDEDVRAAVARNPNTPLETLKRLCDKHEEDLVLRAIAINPHTPIDFLLWLAGLGDQMAYCACKNPALTAEDLDYLAKHNPNSEKSMGIILNKNTSAETLFMLSMDSDQNIKQAALKAIKERKLKKPKWRRKIFAY